MISFQHNSNKLAPLSTPVKSKINAGISNNSTMQQSLWPLNKAVSILNKLNKEN